MIDMTKGTPLEGTGLQPVAWVDGRTLAEVHRDGGGTVCGTYSERYGRTTPLYPTACPTDLGISELVARVKEMFPYTPEDEKGLDEELHPCEWTLVQERKRLHMLLENFPRG